tara:strand:+ start:809 stop:1003 length:195 start_codon:yes stop_codon:yes gene_type:complete
MVIPLFAGVELGRGDLGLADMFLLEGFVVAAVFVEGFDLAQPPLASLPSLARMAPSTGGDPMWT